MRKNLENEFPYERSQPQQLHGALESVHSTILNVVERCRYANTTFKPSVKFQGNEAIFVINAFQIIDQNIVKSLQNQFSTSFKKILDLAKQDLYDANLGFNFSYNYCSDDMKIMQSRGYNSRSYISYSQVWEIVPEATL